VNGCRVPTSFFQFFPALLAGIILTSQLNVLVLAAAAEDGTTQETRKTSWGLLKTYYSRSDALPARTLAERVRAGLASYPEVSGADIHHVSHWRWFDDTPCLIAFGTEGSDESIMGIVVLLTMDFVPFRIYTVAPDTPLSSSPTELVSGEQLHMSNGELLALGEDLLKPGSSADADRTQFGPLGKGRAAFCAGVASAAGALVSDWDAPTPTAKVLKSIIVGAVVGLTFYVCMHDPEDGGWQWPDPPPGKSP